MTTSTAGGHEGHGRSPTQEEIADVINGAEELTRQAAESEQSPTYSAAAEAEQYTAEAAAEYGDVEPGQESAENAAEVQANETLRTDQELLGRHYPVRQLVEKASNARKGVIEYAQASVANMKDTPRLLARHLACRFAESSYNRRKEKAEAVAHLSPKNPLRMLREKRLYKAKRRFDRNKARYESQRNQMVGRLDNVKNNMESRREEAIAKLTKRRSEALTRKEIRRRLRDQGAGRLEARRATKEHINSIPEDQRRRIANALLNAVEANKNSQEASWQTRYAERVSADAQNRVEMLGQELGQTRVDLENTRKQAGEIADMEANLVTVKENVAKLREKAESLSDDSANKFAAMNELVKAENQQAEMEQTIANHHQRLAELWQRQGQLAEELSQAKVNAESAAQTLKDRTQQEAAAKKKAEATQTARNQSVENTFV